MADKRISQLIERVDIANNDVLPIVASGATTTNKVTVSTLQDWMQDNLDVGVTSVGLSMPSAFVVSASPVTSSGNISVTGAGTVSQYIRGDGSLADFPSGGGGGGASVNYYLNGSVSQGTIGGIAYQEMNKVPVLGAGTDFVAIADGYLASFITDAGDPGLLEIPGGNWNFETYFSASSGGGTPTFYVELYKVNSGGTATLIASNSGTPELIAFGTTITPYFSTLAVPTTALAITDRLALRYYVARSGRTITLHTENSHLCQIITTFTTGLTALNGLTAQVQNFATGTSGTDFGISSSSTTHTFNLPDASASARGVVTTGTQTFAGYKIFTGTISANNDIQLASAGTASTTFIKNISGAGLTSIGSNGFGFNNSDNIYFSGSSKGGGIIAFSNTGNQTYTLQNASGTLAFTSQIPANPVGGTGAAGRVAYWNGSGTITSDSLFQWNDTFRRLGIGCTPTVSLDVVGAGALTGALSVGGALNGTSASFNTGTSVTPNFIVFGGGQSAGGGKGNIRSSDSGGGNYWDFGRDNAVTGDFVLSNLGASPYFRVATITGAATFSSSVTAASGLYNGYTSGLPATSGSAARGGLRLNNASNISIDFGTVAAGQAWIQVSDAGNYASNFPLLLNPNGGNVGIGTTGPATFLHIAGTSNKALTGLFHTCIQDFTSMAAGVGGGITFMGYKIAQSNQEAFAGIDGFKENATSGDASGAFRILTQQSSGAGLVERMRITSGGYPKFSNNSSYFYLANPFFEVNQSIADWTQVNVNKAASGTPLGIFVGFTGQSPNNATALFYAAQDSTTDRFQVRSNGGIANYATNNVVLSDERLKRDIEPLESYWDKFKAIEIVRYKFKDQTHDDFNIGVIAQQVEAVAPEFVDVDGWGNKPKVDEEGNEIVNEEEPLKSIYTADLHHATIKVLQEAMAKIEKLETEIDSLKNQIK